MWMTSFCCLFGWSIGFSSYTDDFCWTNINCIAREPNGLIYIESHSQGRVLTDLLTGQLGTYLGWCAWGINGQIARLDCGLGKDWFKFLLSKPCVTNNLQTISLDLSNGEPNRQTRFWKIFSKLFYYFLHFTNLWFTSSSLDCSKESCIKNKKILWWNQLGLCE